MDVVDEALGSAAILRNSNLDCFLCGTKNVNANGLDGIFKDKNGSFVFAEYKFSSSGHDVGVSTLGNPTVGRQLSESWLLNAINKDKKLSESKKTQLRNAIRDEKYRTSLVVVKPIRRGTGVTQTLAGHTDFGVGKPDMIDDIIVIELGL